MVNTQNLLEQLPGLSQQCHERGCRKGRPLRGREEVFWFLQSTCFRRDGYASQLVFPGVPRPFSQQKTLVLLPKHMYYTGTQLFLRHLGSAWLLPLPTSLLCITCVKTWDYVAQCPTIVPLKNMETSRSQ